MQAIVASHMHLTRAKTLVCLISLIKNASPDVKEENNYKPLILISIGN